jgi:hypothetical protein
MQRSQEQRYTPEEYWKLVELFPDRKYEYIDGYIRMLSGDSTTYAQIGGNIVTLLNVLQDSPTLSPIGQTSSHYLQRYADISVLHE